LPSKCKALSSNSSTTKKKEEGRKGEKGEREEVGREEGPMLRNENLSGKNQKYPHSPRCFSYSSNAHALLTWIRV
jgi:hypothetical protein